LRNRKCTRLLQWRGKKEIEVEKFTALDIYIPFRIELMNGDVQKVIIEGKPEIIRALENRSKVITGEWSLRLRDNCIIRSGEVTFTMVVPALKESLLMVMVKTTHEKNYLI
jgi:hypothetical protein